MVREYLQSRILGVLQRCGAMIPLAFQGGTALRFLYSSSRYSEDLDFALEGSPFQYDLRSYLERIRQEFSAEAYNVQLKVNDKRTVQSSFVGFGELLHELGLSARRNEVISVKIEVDTKPPPGAILSTTVVRRHVTLNLQHHDRASLLAGKLHAVLQRPYVKGRDLYDLLWYLSDPDWPAPNLALLNNALQQSKWTGNSLNENNWRKVVARRLQGIVWERVVADVLPFLDQTADANLLTRETLLKLLGVRQKG
jgi:predicted nucleotidyltransferase component of viral defense system